eukprot:5271910-Lingulodinium_polyedra.AAC.1
MDATPRPFCSFLHESTRLRYSKSSPQRRGSRQGVAEGEETPPKGQGERGDPLGGGGGRGPPK